MAWGNVMRPASVGGRAEPVNENWIDPVASHRKPQYRAAMSDDAMVTALSDVDGERGRLQIRGHDLERLAGRVGYEDVCLLLWQGALPSESDRNALVRRLGEARVRAFRTRPAVAPLDDAMDHLRASLAQRATEDPVELTAAVGVAAAEWAARRAGRELAEPDPSLPHPADFLRLVRGERPEPARIQALTDYFVTVGDHGMNASTYTARVIASTGSDLVSSVVGAIGALKGPLHGGAPGPVLDMFDAIGEPARAEAWIEAELAAGRRIMGMGHRVYKVRDPRAAVLEKSLERLEAAGLETRRLALARAIERAAVAVLRRRKPDRPLHANVEFFTAVILEASGVPRPLFSAAFAASRVAGWCAHALEQRATGRLIRPASRYIGPAAW